MLGVKCKECSVAKKKAKSKLLSPPPGTKGGVGENKLKVKRKTVSTDICVACKGTGESSSGSRCYPCSGKGKKK